MIKDSSSLRIYIGLILTLSILAALNVFLPQGNFVPMQELPASKPFIAIVNMLMVLIIYGGLGYLGLRLSRKLGFTDIWDNEVSFACSIARRDPHPERDSFCFCSLGY